MTDPTRQEDPRRELHNFQRRLAEHFTSLREQRSKNEPIFSIEHGLSPSEIEALRAAVAWAVSEDRSLGPTPFPLVIVATEVGYEYNGYEYWPLLRKRLPGWSPQRRESLHRAFEEFVDRFSGFRPSGDWAEQFRLIAWPISHAILPQIYQAQLTDVLYRLGSLSRADLMNPLSLGRMISSKAAHSSDRFRQQAENYEVVGRIASALLVPEEELTSSAIFPATLDRITSDLTRHSESSRQLEAARARSRSVFVAGRSTPHSTGQEVERSARLRPRLGLRLRQADDGFRLQAQLPALQARTVEDHELRDYLMRARVRFEGRSRPVHGRSVIAAGEFYFETNPYVGSRFVSCVSASQGRFEALLNDALALPDLPLVFAFEHGIGKLVRSRSIRPGRQYAVVGLASLEGETPTWVSESGSVVTLNIRMLDVPEAVDGETEDYVEACGLSLRTSTRIVPVGLPGGGWDGEDHAVWVAGQEVFVKVESDRCWSTLEAEFDGRTVNLSARAALLSLGTPSPGLHELNVRLSDGDGRPVNGGLTVQINEPSQSSAYALGVHFDPPLPTFLEVVDGEATMAISGPAGASATLSVTLRAPDSTVLDEVALEISCLPVSARDGRNLLDDALHAHQLNKSASEAQQIEVGVSSPVLGRTTVCADRRFVPLRWIYSDHGKAARLIDNVSDQRPEIGFRSTNEPMVTHKVELRDDDIYGVEAEGLFESRIGNLRASIVMTPSQYSSFSELASANPRIDREICSSVPRMRSLVEAASTWQGADTPLVTATLVVQRVLREIAATIAVESCGDLWAGVEDAYLRHDRWSESKVESAIGDGRQALTALADVRQSLRSSQGDLSSIRDGFIRSIRPLCPTGNASDLGDFALLLAADPSQAARLPASQFVDLGESLIRCPLVLRLARYVTLRLDESESRDLASQTRLESL